MFTIKLNDQFTITCKGRQFLATVHRSFITLQSEEGDLKNAAIFDLLGVDKYDYCEKAYGYKPSDGLWPECYVNDFEALTRVLEALAGEPEVYIKVGVEKQSISSVIKPIEDELKLVKEAHDAKIAQIRDYEKRLELARKELIVLNAKYEKLFEAYNLIKSI